MQTPPTRGSTIAPYADPRFIRLLIILFAATAGVSALLAHNAQVKTPADTVFLQTPRALEAFTLQRADNLQPFSHRDFVGRWSLVYTGYLNCPDLCPTTLAQLASTRAALVASTPEAGLWDAKLRIVFASIDHFRDQPKAISTYTTHFDSSIVPLTGSASQLAALLRSLGFLLPPNAPQTAVGHSSAIALIDPNARLYGLFRHPHDPELIERTLRELLSSATPLEPPPSSTIPPTHKPT